MADAGKRGYWIVHVLKVKDEAKFNAHLAAENFEAKVGSPKGTVRMFGKVRRTLKGPDPVELAAIVEFPSLKAAIDAWDDPEGYAPAKALLGEDETETVDRRIAVIEADALPDLKPGQGFWINHVHELRNERAFFDYAEASMPCFTSAHFGPVAHQFVGARKAVLGAILGFASPEAAIETYTASPEYERAKEAGGIAASEDDVVDRTICVIEYFPAYDQLATKE